MLSLSSKEKTKDLKALDTLDMFNAQLQLEHELLAGYEKQILNLDLNNQGLNLQYAKLQGGIEALKSLAATRKLLINTPAESAVKGLKNNG